MKTKCDVYRCSKKVDTYLYLAASMSPDDLPDELTSLLGKLTQFLDLELNPTSKLARVEASEVLAALGEQGYFLQMPPADLLKAQAPGSGFIQ